MSDESRWYAIQTRPAAEKRVLDGLAELRLYGYFPTERVWRHGQGGRRVPHERPLIRGYVFTHLSPVQWPTVREIDGAFRLVSFDGKPAPVPAAFIARLQHDEAAGAFDHAVLNKPKVFDRGQQVRVTRGEFAGLVGRIAKVKGERRAQLVLTALRWPVTVAMADLDEEPEPAQEAA